MSVGAATSGRAVALEGLGSVPGDLLGDAEVVGELRWLVGLAARVAARSAELIDVAARRGIPESEGFGSPTGWLMALTGTGGGVPLPGWGGSIAAGDAGDPGGVRCW